MYLYLILLNILYILNITFWNKDLHAISLNLPLSTVYVYLFNICCLLKFMEASRKLYIIKIMQIKSFDITKDINLINVFLQQEDFDMKIILLRAPFL